MAWSGLSALWGSAGPSINEAERLLLYAVLATALAVALRKRTIEILVMSLVAMMGVIDVVALWAKLVNVHYTASGAARVNRLQTPFEYWNALGIFGVIGFLLALGLVFENVRREVRIAAAGTLPATALVVYFTFSRGSISRSASASWCWWWPRPTACAGSGSPGCSPSRPCCCSCSPPGSPS